MMVRRREKHKCHQAKHQMKLLRKIKKRNKNSRKLKKMNKKKKLLKQRSPQQKRKRRWCKPFLSLRHL